MTAHEEPPVEVIKNKVTAAILLKRRTLRVLESHRFCEVFARLDEGKRKLVEELVGRDDLKALEELIVKEMETELGETSFRRLRLIARRLGVRNYQRLSKAILLSEIKRYEKVVASQEPAGSTY